MSKKEDIADRVARLAEEYERRCTGCAQTSIADIFDALGIRDDVFKVASGLAKAIRCTRGRFRLL